MATEKNPLSVVWHGVTIEYDEESNRWRFELNGRERFAQSLTNAKAAIDKPDPKEKAKPFERFKAYMLDRWAPGKHKTVEVTSVADSPAWRKEVWITSGNGRSKALADDVYIVCPENDAAIAELVEIDSAKKALDKREEKVRAKMKKITLPKENE